MELQSELLQRFGSFELHTTSEQSDLIQLSELIPDSLGDADDTGRHNCVDSKVSPSRFCYSNGSGPLTDVGPQVLGQGEPKSLNTPKLIERGFPVCSDNSRSMPFTKPGLIPMEGGILADTGGTKTSKFDGALQGIPVIMMMDSGATRNFMSQCLIDKGKGFPSDEHYDKRKNEEKKIENYLSTLEKDLVIIVDRMKDFESSLKEALNLFPENKNLNELKENTKELLTWKENNLARYDL
ncbi:hypothetical protein R6Q59_019361 [Mikania micrantha]